MRSRLDEMRDECLRFHKQHPRVWDLFVKFTLGRIDRGFKNYSARGIFQRIRWETEEAQTSEIEFKLNDHHSPFYARRFMRMYPQHDGFFRTRKQISADNNASCLPPLGPKDFY